mmetsp:Transcript_18858/g.75222  ORF Transcript_18858/g.75222 Transcript_18858/m.75222 type:complete len:270 (+) Transcript_18858:59-868(+)
MWSREGGPQGGLSFFFIIEAEGRLRLLQAEDHGAHSSLRSSNTGGQLWSPMFLASSLADDIRCLSKRRSTSLTARRGDRGGGLGLGGLEFFLDIGDEGDDLVVREDGVDHGAVVELAQRKEIQVLGRQRLHRLVQHFQRERDALARRLGALVVVLEQRLAGVGVLADARRAPSRVRPRRIRQIQLVPKVAVVACEQELDAERPLAAVLRVQLLVVAHALDELLDRYGLAVLVCVSLRRDARGVDEDRRVGGQPRDHRRDVLVELVDLLG